ncbi:MULTISPECIES: glycosyltransferase family protein [Micrococcus]|uniref:hypothetical protein n=1 Tax=Micrococcus luteus TaxID=1270 RepID=UPI0019D1FB6B|nr:hypothetical protein [Micrococcus luteus]MBN6768544.1 hypothetical protein [Micrococcus luteus]MBN6828115.1 hypothetical protein [Micrococcus luteus]MBN6845536.1 hypothetical protein [Micrococcus luteus]MBN6861917.1 hypothetical protein [Micrococcus luteus]MBY0208445.1 hypothetical protein [Micrococcus luteus]
MILLEHAEGQGESLPDVSDLAHHVPVAPGELLSVAIQHVNDADARGAALVQLRFEDAAGERVEVEGWTHVSPSLGEYRYLSAGEGQRVTAFDVTVPDSATHLVLQGHAWKPEFPVRVNGAPMVLRHVHPLDTPAAPFSPDARVRVWDFLQHLPVSPGTASIEGVIRASLPTEKSTALLTVGFLDEAGRPLPGPSDLPQNPTFGPFVQLRGTAEGPLETRFQIAVPSQARWVRIQGRRGWGNSEVMMRAEIEVTEVRSSVAEIDAFLAEIPEGDTLLVIDTTAPPLGHETLSLRPNNLARAFERAGMWVVFLPFSSLQEFPARVSDRVLQVARKDFGRLVRGLTTRRRSMGDTYICSSFPSIAAVALGTQLKTLGWQVVYECRDDMEEFNRVGYSKWYSPALERQMLIVADKVVSVSTALDAKLVSMWPALRDHAVIPNAVNRHVIDQSEGLRTAESFDRREHLRVAGYVGHLTPSWFDWPLITEAARRMPETVFEIIGHGAPQGMSLPSNVHLLGPRSHEQLADIVTGWKVGLIPFLDIPLTRSVDPNKIYEYFAWGLRCVTAPMGSVETYPSTWVHRGVDEFVEKLDEALSTPWAPGEREAMESFVQSSDWDDRAERLLSYYGITTEGRD